MKIYFLLILIIWVGWNQAFPASIAMLNNTNSYSIGYKGATIFNVVSELTYSIGTCDINGDGKKDIIYINGDGYVVLFGDVSRFGNARPINDSFADGINGFKIKIVQPERFPVCGDVNGDGIDDIMVSNSELYYSNIYVIYGSKSPFKALIDTFNGTNGFLIYGTEDQGAGVGKSICDVNGDGVKDIVFSTYYGFFGGSVFNSNTIYVIFGLKNGTKFKIENGEYSKSEFVEGKGFTIKDLFAATLTCGDINNDGYDDLYLLNPKSQIVFGKAIFPLNYIPKFDGKEALNLTGIIWDSKNTDNRFGTSSFGDFNGDGLTDMAVTNGNYSSYEVYIIFGKRNETWPSKFDVKSRNSSNVIAFTKGSGSKAYNCDSLIMGDINGDGFDDLQCYSPEFVWVVYGSELPFPSVVDLSAYTSPLFDECRGFILEQVNGRVLANSDFNNDKIMDLMVIKSKVLYGVYGEKLPMNASLGLIYIDIPLEYQANGTYVLLEGNYNPVSGKCPPTNITVQVLNAQPSDSLDIAPSNDITVKKLSPSNIIIYNKNRDPKFLKKIAKIQYSTQRNDSIATINFKYPGYLNETISVNTIAPIIPQTNVIPCICPTNNTCSDFLCVPPGTTDTNEGCAKYPCSYGLECNATVNKCEFPRDCMSCVDLKCGSNEKCELHKSRNAKICKLHPFCL
ncbi:tenascin X [Tieghemostelium lacteum]|uniref:Tenascin X n=1 Tax=Tieghemostelium lacteum TaxID=361077 RepID=A0A152A4I5_TIELA|nr:tenascin X [Tieghemostelium lacteum]|eukprot:KYR01148.1 tenascin X [Tieghemostelium lacteum]